MKENVAPLRRDSALEGRRAEINMSHIRVGGGGAGFIFAAGTVYIFLVGIPALRGFFVGAVIVGSVVSVALGLFHKYKPRRPVATLRYPPFSN